MAWLLVYSFCSSWDILNAAIAVVIHRFGNDRTAIAGTVGQATIMREEQPLTFELHDSRMGGIGVTCNLANNAHRGIRTANLIGYSVGNLLRPLGGIGQIVLALILMHPRSFGKTGHIDLVYFASISIILSFSLA